MQQLLGERVTTLSFRGLSTLQSLVEDKLAVQLGDTNNQQYVKTLNSYPKAKALLAALSSGSELSERRGIISRAVEPEPHVRAILDDLPLMPNRLLGKEPEKFSVYDRQISEGEFRAASSIPIAGLSVSVAYQSNQYWIVVVGVLVAGLLFVQARTRTIMANDQLADFVRSGSVTSGTIADLDQAVIRLKRTELLPAEVAAFMERAKAAEDAGQLDAAVGWYKVPAQRAMWLVPRRFVI